MLGFAMSYARRRLNRHSDIIFSYQTTNPCCQQPSKVYPPHKEDDLREGQQAFSLPDVHTIQITKAENILVLACDGGWDVPSDQEAVSYVYRRLLIQRAAVGLVNKVNSAACDGEKMRGGAVTVQDYEYACGRL